MVRLRSTVIAANGTTTVRSFERLGSEQSPVFKGQFLVRDSGAVTASSVTVVPTALQQQCVFFTCNRPFHPSTPSTTSVRADCVEPQKDTSSATAKLRHRDTIYIAVMQQAELDKQSRRHCHAMSPYWIRQIRHTHSMRYMNQNPTLVPQVFSLRSGNAVLKALKGKGATHC